MEVSPGSRKLLKHELAAIRKSRLPDTPREKRNLVALNFLMLIADHKSDREINVRYYALTYAYRCTLGHDYRWMASIRVQWPGVLNSVFRLERKIPVSYDIVTLP
jgi:hypothetical protein